MSVLMVRHLVFFYAFVIMTFAMLFPDYSKLVCFALLIAPWVWQKTRPATRETAEQDEPKESTIVKSAVSYIGKEILYCIGCILLIIVVVIPLVLYGPDIDLDFLAEIEILHYLWAAAIVTLIYVYVTWIRDYRTRRRLSHSDSS